MRIPAGSAPEGGRRARDPPPSSTSSIALPQSGATALTKAPAAVEVTAATSSSAGLIQALPAPQRPERGPTARAPARTAAAASRRRRRLAAARPAVTEASSARGRSFVPLPVVGELGRGRRVERARSRCHRPARTPRGSGCARLAGAGRGRPPGAARGGTRSAPLARPGREPDEDVLVDDLADGRLGGCRGRLDATAASSSVSIRWPAAEATRRTSCAGWLRRSTRASRTSSTVHGSRTPGPTAASSSAR